MPRDIPGRPGRGRHRCRRRPRPRGGAGAGRGRCPGRPERPARRGRRGRRGDQVGRAARPSSSRATWGSGRPPTRWSRPRSTEFGQLDIVVNNAGITRDRMLFNLSDEEWDLVLKVHLRGHFLLSRNAASYWRARSKETGAPVYGRVVNTASEAFLGGSPGAGQLRRGQGRHRRAHPVDRSRPRPDGRHRERDLPPRPHRDDRRRVRRGRVRPGGRPVLARPRRAPGRLPRLARRRTDHRPGLRRVRRDGRRAGRARSWSSGSTPAARCGAPTTSTSRWAASSPTATRRSASRPTPSCSSPSEPSERNTMGRLTDKVAIVTGGSQGQGAAICRAFVDEGAKVVIADIAEEAGEKLAVRAGGHGVLPAARRQRGGVLDRAGRGGQRALRAGQRAGQQRRHPALRRHREDARRRVRAAVPGQPARLLPRHEGGRPHHAEERRRLDRQRLVDRGPGRHGVAAPATPPPSSRSAA